MMVPVRCCPRTDRGGTNTCCSTTGMISNNRNNLIALSFIFLLVAIHTFGLMTEMKPLQTWRSGGVLRRGSSPKIHSSNNSTNSTTTKINNKQSSLPSADKEKLKSESVVLQSKNETLSDIESNTSLLNESHTASVPSKSKPSTTTTVSSPSQTQHTIIEWFPVGDSVGYYDESQGQAQPRLVVLANHTHMFWNKNGQKRLCNLLQIMKKKNTTVTKTATTPPPILRLQINCTEISHSEAYGQGNWVTAFYAVRLATSYFGIDLDFQCLVVVPPSSSQSQSPEHSNNNDKQQNYLDDLKHNLLLPWLTGYYPAHSSQIPGITLHEEAEEEEVCTNRYDRIRIDKMAVEMKHDIQRMAEQIPLLSEDHDDDDEYDGHDDVVIHFRCGDILGGQLRNDFGMIPFRTYTKYINHNETSTIGIVTQPFETDRNRQIDRGRIQHCRRVVERLVEYLQENMIPAAATGTTTTIRIHNGLNETIPMAYARIVEAKQQAFTTLSSFGIFPVIATKGDGYFQRGNDGVNPWTTYLRVDNNFSNLHEMNATVLSAKAMYYVLETYGLDPLLDWFVAKDEDNAKSIPQVQEGIEAAANAPGKTMPKLKPKQKANNGPSN
jgi:hypothetical protein